MISRNMCGKHTRWSLRRCPKKRKARWASEFFDKSRATSVAVTPSNIRSAHERIGSYIRRTPILETASPIGGAPPLSLKLEYLQATGSFKARGRLPQSPDPTSGCVRLRHGVGRQPRRRRRLRRPEARDPSTRLRAGNRYAREDREDQGLCGRGRRRRRLALRRRSSAATPMSPRAARCQFTLTTRSRRLLAKARWRWNGRRTSSGSGSRSSTRSSSRLAAANRSWRCRLVSRPGQGRRRRA